MLYPGLRCPGAPRFVYTALLVELSGRQIAPYHDLPTADNVLWPNIFCPLFYDSPWYLAGYKVLRNLAFVVAMQPVASVSFSVSACGLYILVLLGSRHTKKIPEPCPFVTNW